MCPPHAQAIALWDYVPSIYDETALAFRKGDVVAVLEMGASGSWRGSVHKRTGFFPSTYVGPSYRTACLPACLLQHIHAYILTDMHA